MGHHEHEELSRSSIDFSVLTFTDSRNEATDKSGKIIIDMLVAAGHRLNSYSVVREDTDSMRACLEETLDDARTQAVICNGGTGLSSRDNSIEVVRPMLDKELEGFGEIFRLLSFQQIGAAAIMSRATAGIIGKKPIFCLPGSTKAVRLAMQRIIVPQLAHLVWEAMR